MSIRLQPSKLRNIFSSFWKFINTCEDRAGRICILVNWNLLQSNLFKAQFFSFFLSFWIISMQSNFNYETTTIVKQILLPINDQPALMIFPLRRRERSVPTPPRNALWEEEKGRSVPTYWISGRNGLQLRRIENESMVEIHKKAPQYPDLQGKFCTFHCEYYFSLIPSSYKPISKEPTNDPC